MTNKRVNFKVMPLRQFIAYLENKNIAYSQTENCTEDSIKVIRVEPQHFRLVSRIFNQSDGKQIHQKAKLDRDAELLKSFIKIIDEKINNMSTKGVYYPRRIKPKWDSLSNDSDKLKLFEKYISNRFSSIGLLKLIDVNLCHKTLESILIEHPDLSKLLVSDMCMEICIDKFSRYENGKTYLKSKGIN